MLRFVVPGEPVPKGRPRFSVRKGRDGVSFVQAYTDGQTSAYSDKVRLLARVAANQARWFTSPKDRFSIVIKIFRTHFDKGGDIDNYEKNILDSLIPKKGQPGTGIIDDDRYVRGLGTAIKQDKANPRVEVEIRRFPAKKSSK